MLTRATFFLLLFVLHCPPSLLMPLAQQDVSSISNTNDLVLLGSNQIEQIIPNNSNVAEIIQQIDVKDDENHVISNINHVVVSDENNQNDNNETQNNRTNNVLEQTVYISSVPNTTGVTNQLKDSSSLLLTNSLNGTSGNPLKADNLTVKGLENKLANETQTNPLNTTKNANGNNAPVKDVGTVQNDITTTVNVSSTIVPYISGGTTINFLEETGVATLETIDRENTLHESLNDTEVELAWRSDIPVGKTKTKNLKHIAQLDAQITLKPETDKSNNIIDVSFRAGEHQGTQNNVTKENHVFTVPLDNKQNNTTHGSNAPDNATLANAIENLIEDISSVEAPAFRSLIPDKIRKLLQVSNVVNSELNETKNHNLVLKLSPESSPIPTNDLLGGALSFIKRLKRSTHTKAENIYPWQKNCKSKRIDEHHTITSCKKPKLNVNHLKIPTRKSFYDDISNVLKLYDSIELVCPLSVIVKLYTHRVLDNIKNDPDNVLNKILISFVKGNKNAINLVSKELLDLPVPVKVRLQLVHGKTKEFIEQLSDLVDATLCSLS